MGTPTGWKKLGDATYCPQCWRKKYILRAITMPVSSPLDCSWDELRKALRSMWAQTTAASNWMMTELYARDVRRGSEENATSLTRASGAHWRDYGRIAPGSGKRAGDSR